MTSTNSIQNPLIIYTIGHSNVPASKILDLLFKFEIKGLIDVRSSPYSQYSPQFNRETFKQSLKKAGIEYVYAGDHLGGRPKDPSCYKNGQVPDEHADFLHLVNYPQVMNKDFFQEGIRQLIKIAKKHQVVVMCSEEDPSRCHRHHLIGKYLVQQGVPVMHIRWDGNVVKDQLFPNISEEPPAQQLNLLEG